MERCFACNKPLGKSPHLADTREGQIPYVGAECYKLIKASGEAGYQPALGGPRLWDHAVNRVKEANIWDAKIKVNLARLGTCEVVRCGEGAKCYVMKCDENRFHEEAPVFAMCEGHGDLAVRTGPYVYS